MASPGAEGRPRTSPVPTGPPEQAKAAALAAVPDTVTSVQLGNENGFLVYDVTIGNQEVIVDAGNGRVLYQGAVDAGESGWEP
ncbi:PepSY domain-containing protein [Deinococcus humi]|uniref:Putative membrane protein YkoI n=1 Tax=Deinococcus humi TaxID=662880 RepID=A0A7W8NFE8_9DEIO|nr:PepSY domain-containing protein [Deinococcus humi]MBB5364366.1 putative membrane protein YkoI [Deinococcus humi]GGO33408.1 hypothetical protein GCM10008949_32520 [Deinococcus humi]